VKSRPVHPIATICHTERSEERFSIERFLLDESAFLLSRCQTVALLLAPLVLAGCGAPGEPQPLTPPVPTAITDLTAHQRGNAVELDFTLPSHRTGGEHLLQPPAAEIFRGTLKPDGSPDNKSFRLVTTIPGALAQNYANDGKIQFSDAIPATDLGANRSVTVAYRVRTRAAKDRDSADSNTVIAKVFPVADKIPSIDAKVTQTAIELSWPAPVLPASSSGQALFGYHVYRGELDAAEPAPAANNLSGAKWKSPLVLLAQPVENSYSDTLFEFNKAYVYLVRSVTTVAGNSIESDNSAPAIVTPRDIFPPAAPQNLVAAVLPGENNAPVVDLSWSINTESDLAGYRVYRSEKQGERGQPLQSELLLAPSFRDLTAKPGQQYWYTATAVDRAGNESAPSDQAQADLTEPVP